MHRRGKELLLESEARYVLRDIVRGLMHLSQVCKVMHRDIKMDNILVTLKRNKQPGLSLKDRCIEDFEFKLGDLGLAKPILSERQL